MVAGTSSLRMNASSSPRGTCKALFKRKAAAASSRSPSRNMFQLPTVTIVASPSEENEGSKRKKKYIHVHRFKQTSLYGAWFNDPTTKGKKKRLFFGCHQSAYLAARAQDRAALKYKPFAVNPTAIKLNFKEEDYVEDEELRKTLTNPEFGVLLKRESRSSYTKMEPTPCLRKFIEQERAKGNLPVEEFDPRKNAKIKPLAVFLKELMEKRNASSSDSNPKPLPKISSEDREAVVQPKRRSWVSTSAPKAEKSQKRLKSVASFMLPSAKPAPSRPVAEKKIQRRSPIQESMPLETAPVPQVAKPTTDVQPKSVTKKAFTLRWGERRSRTLKRRLAPQLETKFKVAGNTRNKLQYKLQKIESADKLMESAKTAEAAATEAAKTAEAAATEAAKTAKAVATEAAKIAEAAATETAKIAEAAATEAAKTAEAAATEAAKTPEPASTRRTEPLPAAKTSEPASTPTTKTPKRRLSPKASKRRFAPKTPKRRSAPRLETKFKVAGNVRNKLQYKLRKMEGVNKIMEIAKTPEPAITEAEKTLEPASTLITEPLAAAKTPEPALTPTIEPLPAALALLTWNMLQYNLQQYKFCKMESAETATTEAAKTPEPAASTPTSDSVPADPSTPTSESVPADPALLTRNKLQYKLDKMENAKTVREPSSMAISVPS